MSADAIRSRCFKHVIGSGAAIAVLIVVSRFVYIVSQIDTGWSMVAERWLAGTVGQFHPQQPVANREPPEQAAYWLSETDRIFARSETPARPAMGAAWVLDAPAPGFRSKHLEPPLVPMFPPTVANTEKTEREFEERCGLKCLELAKRATDAEPANLDGWRMRALLTANFRLGGDAFGRAPRSANWAAVLDEAARHDPDNALYDYLAALNDWRASADYGAAPAESSAEGISCVLAVRDAKRFASGVARFDQGRQKKFVAFGESGLSAIVDFLARSRLTLADQAGVIRGSLCVLRPQMLIVDLMRWQMARSDDVAAAGDPAEALSLLKQRLHVLDQIEVAGEWTADELILQAFRQQTLCRMVQLAEAEQELTTPEERSALVRDCRAAILRDKTWNEAARRAAKPPPAAPSPCDLIKSSFLISTPECVGLMLLGGLLGWLASGMLGHADEQLKLLAIWQHAVAWLAAWSASFAVQGMAPAGLISPETQRKVAIVVLVGAVLFVSWLLWRSRFRFSLRAAFVAVFVCAVLCMPLAALYRQGVFNDLESLAVPPKGAANLDAATVQGVLQIPPQSWAAAVWQWLLHSGCFFGALACPLLAAVWSALRRAGGKDSEGSCSSRAWWSALFRDASRSALALAVVLLVVDFALVPSSLIRVERQYEEITQFFRDPRGSYDDFRKAIRAVEGDKAALDNFQGAIDREMAVQSKPSR
ncbi:MAG TPA: hypothetical protein VGN42_13820 [Pirellulales bacterium]|nr:hypothetical protein [Pirellulales bacterium]